MTGPGDDARTALRDRIEERAGPWPSPIEHAEVLASTNGRLKERAREGAPEWSVVVADRQSAGRGRGGSVWVSPAGNLFLSVLLRPREPPKSIGLLPLVAGVAACEALRRLGVAAAVLKWPNDVLVGPAKIAGVLLESVWSESRPEAVIAGIGVNLALDPRELPTDLRPLTTSVAAETGRSVDRDAAAAEVLAQLRLWYDALARDGAAASIAAWRSRSAPWWGRVVEVTAGNQTIRGVARDVGEDGALVLDLETGGRVVVVAGAARLVRLR
jgi:BirA family biotin operon repressor/biotin-[acetyl-CoA-carboxylase] ligase